MTPGALRGYNAQGLLHSNLRDNAPARDLYWLKSIGGSCRILGQTCRNPDSPTAEFLTPNQLHGLCRALPPIEVDRRRRSPGEYGHPRGGTGIFGPSVWLGQMGAGTAAGNVVLGAQRRSVDDRGKRTRLLVHWDPHRTPRYVWRRLATSASSSGQLTPVLLRCCGDAAQPRNFSRRYSRWRKRSHCGGQHRRSCGRRPRGTRCSQLPCPVHAELRGLP